MNACAILSSQYRASTAVRNQVFRAIASNTCVDHVSERFVCHVNGSDRPFSQLQMHGRESGNHVEVSCNSRPPFRSLSGVSLSAGYAVRTILDYQVSGRHLTALRLSRAPASRERPLRPVWKHRGRSAPSPFHLPITTMLLGRQSADSSILLFGRPYGVARPFGLELSYFLTSGVSAVTLNMVAGSAPAPRI